MVGIDDAVELSFNSKVKPGDTINRYKKLPIDIYSNDLNKSKFNDEFTTMEVESTFIPGETVLKVCKNNPKCFPESDKINKNKKYIKLYDFATDSILYIELEIFRNIIGKILFLEDN